MVEDLYSIYEVLGSISRVTEKVLSKIVLYLQEDACKHFLQLPLVSATSLQRYIVSAISPVNITPFQSLLTL